MKPELLAPVQDKEHLLSAQKGGADAVYLGLREFSARQRGTNFTQEGLAEAISWCHGHGIRVYVAFNTVVKEREVPRIAKFLGALRAQGADGVIVQDLGVASLIHRLFPDLLLHASTQLALHNLEGVKEAERWGFQRVILARELSYDQVKAISRESPLKLEVFVHGSLCYSFSGLCLASSFLGGYSGNRGWCTQACRRSYYAGGRESHPFSMADLSLAKQGKLLRSLPVAGWKIEGRMKYPAYVENAVRAYRLIREGREKEALGLLRKVKTRPFTSGFLGKAASESLTAPKALPFTGTFAGKVSRMAGGKAEVRLASEIRTGQKLRVQSESTGKGNGFRLSRIESGGRSKQTGSAGTRVRIDVPQQTRKGDLLFIVDREKKTALKLKVKPQPWQGKAASIRKEISQELDKKPSLPEAQPSPGLTFETDDPSLAGSPPGVSDRVMLVLTDKLIKNLRSSTVRRLGKEAGISVPPVTLPERCSKVRDALKKYAKWGIELFEINNLSGWELIPQGVRVQAGPFLYSHNRLAAEGLLKRGAERIVFPVEGDLETLEALASAGLAPFLEVILFAHVPLFNSRTPVNLKGGRTITDGFGERFQVQRRDGQTYLFGERPYCIFSKRKELTQMGLRSFRIKVNTRLWRPAKLPVLIRAYKSGQDIRGSTPFNMDHGLK